MVKRKALLNVQISRGIAASVVVLAHACLFDKRMFHGWLVEGWCGVDFFFVLSGFIIFYANYTDIANPGRLAIYLYKRFVRVFPIYWLYTILVLLANFALSHFLKVHLVSWINLSPKNLVACFTLYPTNAAANVMPIIPPAWTLSYEVCFYAMFGILIALKPRYSFSIFGFWACLCLTGLAFPLHFNNLLLNVLVTPRNLEFLFGGLVAYLVLKPRYRIGEPYLYAILAASICLLAISWANAHEQYRYLKINPALSFGVSFSLIVFSVVQLEKNRERVAGRVKLFFVYLGNASYSIYLVHFLVINVLFSILHKAGLQNSYAKFWIILFVSEAAGCLAYSFVEKPLLRTINGRYLPRFGPATTTLTQSGYATVH
jgi:exopolysaccharide production protein ExoZ